MTAASIRSPAPRSTAAGAILLRPEPPPWPWPPCSSCNSTFCEAAAVRFSCCRPDRRSMTSEVVGDLGGVLEAGEEAEAEPADAEEDIATGFTRACGGVSVWATRGMVPPARASSAIEGLARCAAKGSKNRSFAVSKKFEFQIWQKPSAGAYCAYYYCSPPPPPQFSSTRYDLPTRPPRVLPVTDWSTGRPPWPFDPSSTTTMRTTKKKKRSL